MAGGGWNFFVFEVSGMCWEEVEARIVLARVMPSIFPGF